MGIEEYFDGKYCINLDRRNDRWVNNCLPQFKDIGITVERFSAVDGVDLDLPHGKTYNGELAGSYSHMKAIKQARDNGIERLLLLEDDVVFIDEVNNKFSSLINNIPNDWDIIFFGGNHVGGQTPVNNGVVKLGGSYAIHACGINKKAYDILIQHLETSIDRVVNNREHRYTPSVAADYFLAKLHKVLNVYCFKPHLAWQLEDFSDIQQTKVNYKFLK